MWGKFTSYRPPRTNGVPVAGGCWPARKDLFGSPRDRLVTGYRDVTRAVKVPGSSSPKQMPMSRPVRTRSELTSTPR